MCYGCTMCNKCGKFDIVKATQAQRICERCGLIAADLDITCSKCGADLPPVLPAPPGATSDGAA